MEFSLTPVFSAVELGFVIVLAWRTARLAPVMSMRPVYAFLLWVTSYGIITSVLGARGVSG